jgi:hypothetical protein
VDVPRPRSKAFKPLADAVSVIGTLAMIRLGIAAYATADPMLTTVEPMISAASVSVLNTRPM